MGYPPNPDQLGDIGTDVTGWLQNFRDEAANIQEQTQLLAQKIANTGNVAVRVSNQVTGAAAGAKAGASTGGAIPASITEAIAKIPTPVLYGAGVFALYKLLK
jgi:hypothetical protein